MSENPAHAMLRLKVDEADAGRRLAGRLREAVARRGLGNAVDLLRRGAVLLNGREAAGDERLRAGDEITLRPEPEPETKPAPPSRAGRRRKPDKDARRDAKQASELRSRVLHEDERLIVINKPPGLAVQAAEPGKRDLEGMLRVLQGDRLTPPRLVHRLDTETAGVMLLARDAETQQALLEAFRERQVEKIYWALVVGRPSPPEGELRSTLAKARGAGGPRVVSRKDGGGQTALTRYRTLGLAGHYALLELRPQTGRMHQLRVHMSELGTPIIGDGKYGGKIPSWGARGRKLHLTAKTIGLTSPFALRVSAPLPSHFEQTLRELDLKAPERPGEP